MAVLSRTTSRRHNETMYKQCNLSRPVIEGEFAGGTAWMTSWIRAELAIPGAWIDDLEDPETGRWESGWKVEDATEPPMPESLLLRQAHNYDKLKRLSEG